jgi:pimeloyl-ACP methyl ester carboxylesterase
MPTAAVNGTEITYQDAGGDGPVVVFSHGYLMDHSMFDAQVEALSPEYRVIAWDERSHGGTRSPGPFTYWDSARDLLGLLDHLGVERAVLGGMSQGGFLSMRATLLAPARVRGLILIDTEAGAEDPAVVPGYEQMHQIWLDQGPEPVQEVVAAMILGPGQWDDWYAKWAAVDNDQGTFAFRCLMDRDDLTDRIGEIACPALIVHGTADAAIPIAKAEQLRDGLGGSTTLAAIDGGTHASNLTHPAEVNKHILGFLATLGD